MSKSKIQQAIERGVEAKKIADEETSRILREKADQERRERELREAEYRRLARSWVSKNLEAFVEESTASGRRELDVTSIARNCTPYLDDRILAEVIAEEAGGDLQVKSDCHENCDYDTGRGDGTYYYTYRAVW